MKASKSLSDLSDNAREIFRLTLESDFREFIRYFFWVQNGLKFQWNDHHDKIVEALMRCYVHRCKRLVINVPPRYSKTEIVVVMFIAWCLARNPRAQFIHLSYSDLLAMDNSARVRELVMLDEYQALWPLEMNPDRSAKALWRTTQNGGLKAGAAGGEVRGFGAGVAYTEPGVPAEDTNPENVPFGGAILIDDPMKGDDVESDAERIRVNRRLNATIKSRCNAPWTPIIMIMQRLHDDDPSGFVLNGGTGETWEHLKIPVINEDGSPLWPFRHKMEDLIAIQVADKFVWNGQYMQEPIPDEGDFFVADKVHWYKKLPKHLNYYGSSDYAASDASGADYTEHAVWGIDPDGNVYAVDWWSGQTKTDVWVEEQIDLAARYGVEMWGGETGPIKAAVEPWLTQRMRDRKVYFPMRWVNHSTANYKVANARSFQGMWEAGRVYLPEGKEWAQNLLRQLTRFPLGTLDDKVDACSIFARLIAKTWEPVKPKPKKDEIKLNEVVIRMSDFEPKPKEW